MNRPPLQTILGICFVTATVATLSSAAWHFAFATPPDTVDPMISQWFESLRQPGTGFPCCSIADCRTTESRMVGNTYEVLLGDRWRDVPFDRVLDHTPNPTGRAVVCYSPVEGILCFVRAPET